MSENKRFIIDFENNCIVDTLTKVKYSTIFQIKPLMNKLNDENEELKKELDSFESVSFTDWCDGTGTTLYMKEVDLNDR